MTTHAIGELEVELSPQPLHDGAADSGLGRMSIHKQFHGDLEASSKGEMLSARTDVEGSAGYVAIERVSGLLHGRRGTFALQHSGTMDRGVPRLSVTVVPDSGTGELEGLNGSMTIEVAEGRHTYGFEYTLAANAPETPEPSPASHVHHAIDYIEIEVVDMAESKRFYTAAFEWEFNDYGPDYAGIRKDGGEAGGLRLAPRVPTGGPLVILYSENLDTTLAKVRDAGGRIIREPFDFPGGRRFHFQDPSGNELAVWSAK